MSQVEIAAQEVEHGPGRNPRTDPLRSILEYLLAQGNRPAQWWQEDGWWSYPGGEMHYLFTNPIDAAQLREHFVFPSSIQVQEDGSIRNSLNRVDISHDCPQARLAFSSLRYKGQLNNELSSDN